MASTLEITDGTDHIRIDSAEDTSLFLAKGTVNLYRNSEKFTVVSAFTPRDIVIQFDFTDVALPVAATADDLETALLVFWF
jgi:hypothetical protein